MKCVCKEVNVAYGGCRGESRPCQIHCLPAAQRAGKTCWQKGQPESSHRRDA